MSDRPVAPRRRSGTTRLVHLVANIDGGARGNPGPAGYGVSIKRAPSDEAARHEPEAPGRDQDELYGFIGVATNNMAEYAALLALLEHVGRLRPDSLTIRSDSELLVRQMRGEYRVKDPKLQVLNTAAHQLLAGLPRVVFEHVPREENRAADALANRAMDLRESSGPLPAAILSLAPPAGQATKPPSL